MHMPRLGFASLMGLLALLLWFLGGLRAYGGLRGWAKALVLVPFGLGLGLGRRPSDGDGDPFAPASERGRAASPPGRRRLRIGTLMIVVAACALPSWALYGRYKYGSLWRWALEEIIAPIGFRDWAFPEEPDKLRSISNSSGTLTPDRIPAMTRAGAEARWESRAASVPMGKTSDPPEFIRLPPRGDREPPRR